MKINTCLIIFIQLILAFPCLGNMLAEAEKETENKQADRELKTIAAMNILPVNQSLHALLSLLKQTNINDRDVENILAKLTLSKLPLNAAEQYLLLVVQALIKNNSKEKHTDNYNSRYIIELLEQAGKLSKNISEQQLSQPEFLQLHLVLADNYAKTGQYDLAYLEKKHYLEKYYLYRKNKRLSMISSLEQSFELENKKSNNLLLASQNEVNAKRVEEVQKQEANHKYNFTLIISTVIVFVLLFFRQLKIRNKLIHLTKTDTLTGLANRSALFERGVRLVSSFSDQPTELSVLLLDLDHFKKVNDNFGHQAGDQVLIKMSELVGETMGSRDFFARLGGEEFVALLPFADSNKAKAIAMRINEKIAQYDFSSFMFQSKITVSIGVATMENNEMSFDNLLHCADLAMYQAKEQGRNSVVCYQNIASAQERRGN
jgi:diguanylate cyclase (GGDEF)-like protein